MNIIQLMASFNMEETKPNQLSGSNLILTTIFLVIHMYLFIYLYIHLSMYLYHHKFCRKNSKVLFKHIFGKFHAQFF